MSYILDALKRADAERERGAVPGLHTQPVTTSMPVAGSSPQRRLSPLLAGVFLLSVIAVGWWVWQSPERDTRAVEVSAATPPAPPAATASALVPAVQDVVSAPAPKPAPPSSTAAAVPAPSKTQVKSVVAATEANPVAPSKPISVAHSAASAAPLAAVVAPLLNELPEDIRRQIPTLTITGAVDSDYPAQRMLLVNGQVLKQGGMLSSDLSLDEIRAHSSVLSFRGTKFRITY